MQKLKALIKEHRTFCIVLSCALAVNIIAVGSLAYVMLHLKHITVTVDGRTAQYQTMKDSVGDVIEGWGVTLEEEDVVDPGYKAKITEGMDLNIKQFVVKHETVSEETKFKTKTEEDSTMSLGKTKVKRKGVKGEDKVTYEVTYLGGEEMARKEIDRETVKKPVTKIVLEGTMVTVDGVNYTRSLTVSSTAYCLNGRTATGTTVHYGTIAVDPRVIPLGSKCYVEGYGECVAEDTGGAIKGNIIDVWFPSYGQCRSWGRRTVTIYIK